MRHRFRNPSLLVEAFSHPSWSHQRGLPSNSRLEFLGDAVLELLTAEFLYARYPDLSEGALTQQRSVLVNRKTLSEIANALQLDRHVLVDHSQRGSDDRKRESLLADAYEAAVGALYLDGGIDAVRRFVQFTLLDRSEEIIEAKLQTNYKSQLLQLMQSRRESAASYVIRREEGPPHARVFEVDVLMNGEVLGTGRGTRLKEAEQAAARSALGRLTKADSALKNVNREKKNPLE